MSLPLILRQLFLYRVYKTKTSSSTLYITDKKIEENLELVKNQATTAIVDNEKKENFLESIGEKVYDISISFTLFMEFFGRVFLSGFDYLKNIKSIRHKEIAFEINESAIKALGIISITSFL